jgi:isopenicillin N synthase-like dioxygenase
MREDPLTVDGLPIIDLRGRHEDLARALDHACREFGFFYLIGHGVDLRLVASLAGQARAFFAQPSEQKLQIAMARGGRAWRGYFPVGGELTSGRPDRKEGLYFGTELTAEDPRVQAGLPLHGSNLFPELPGFRERVLEYMNAVTAVGQSVLSGIAGGLGLSPEYFLERYTRDPTVLFRIFSYPPQGSADELGVGEHTDYGLVTLLWQDDTGGLEVWNRERWLPAPPVADAFVCNVGDMLERLTGGRYTSALHRARNNSRHDRISMPLFLDPSFDAVLEPIEPSAGVPAASNVQRARQRWDGLDLTTLKGTYGEYLLGKVGKVFPELRQRHLERGTG